jgi:quercetin dioxygenase-like cupin family protein
MAADPRVVWMPGGTRTEIHLGDEDTAGAFCLLVDHPPPGWSLPPHLHHGTAETIHIVEGAFEVEMQGRRIPLTAGETVHVHADTVHATANVGDTEGRRVLVFSPAGMERFFLEAGAPTADEPMDAAKALEAAIRHGWEFVRQAGR